jgi:hypothetical protein
MTCPMGSYCPSAQLIAPTICPPGFVCPSTGASAATPCFSSFYCPSKGMQSINSSFACPIGSYCPSGLSVPTICPIGYYCSFSGMSTPMICPVGNYCPVTGANATMTCPIGSYCPSVGLSKPLSCPTTAFCPSRGLSVSTICTAGAYCSLSGMSAPTTCPTGTYCPTGQSSPTNCPASAYCSSSGMSAPTTCPSGAYCPTTGVTAPVTCPTGTYCPTGMTAPLVCQNGTLPSISSLSCQPCPQGAVCLLGNSVPLFIQSLFGSSYQSASPSTWQTPTSVVSPIDIISLSQSARFTVLQNNVAYSVAVIASLGLLVGLYVHHYNVVFPSGLAALDLMFRLAHYTPADSPVMAYKTTMGVVFSASTSIIIALVASLVVIQTAIVFAPITSLSTGLVPFEPLGLFAINVTVTGFNLAAPCSSGLMNLAIDIPSSFLSVFTDGTRQATPIKSSIFLPDLNTCQVTWRCEHCKLSTTTSPPTFTLQTTTAAWANLYAFTFTTPSFSTKDGTLYDSNALSTSISQVIFPTDSPLDSVAFRRDYASQRVTLLLTGSKLVDIPNGLNYTAYQPFISAVDKAVQTSSQVGLPYMTPLSPFSSSLPGFSISFELQRNTVHTSRYTF